MDDLDFYELSEPELPLFSNNNPVVQYIEGLISRLLEDLNHGQSLYIALRTRTSNPQSRTVKNGNYSYPAKSYQSAWRFTIVLAILDIIHEAVIKNKIVSKRDIYYQDPALFKSQAIVDRYVDDIAYTIGVSRTDLHVAAEPRGLIAGPLLLRQDSNQIHQDTFNDGEGVTTPISTQFEDMSINPDNPPRFLLVIEKRATFHTLSRALFHNRYNCILLTGQGYPDLATRSFLYYFHARLAWQVPCYALVDYDPDGLSIYNVYARGSQALSHETDVTVPDLKLLGLRAAEASLAAGASTDKENDEEKSIGLSFLSQRERQRARGLLKRLTASSESEGMDAEQRSYMLNRWDWQESEQQKIVRENITDLKKELQTCLILGYKVEIQILDRRPGGLESWILSKLAHLFP